MAEQPARFDWQGIAIDLREELYRRVSGVAIVDTWFAIVRKHQLAEPREPGEVKKEEGT